MRHSKALAAFAAVATAVLAGWAASPVAAQGLPTEPQQEQMDTQEFQDWTLRCLPEGEQRRCEMVQPVEDPESGEPVMMMVVTRQGGGNPPVAWLVLPLGVLLPPGVGVSVDGAEPQRLAIRHCEPGGCLVPWELTEDSLASLRSGNRLEILAYDIDEQQVAVPVSLLGFTAALEALPQ